MFSCLDPAMRRGHHPEPEVLGDVILQGRHLRAYCRRCLRSAPLSAPDLVKKLGYDFAIADLRPRLRCRECGRNGARVEWLEPERG
jgi:hypothetical protein